MNNNGTCLICGGELNSYEIRANHMPKYNSRGLVGYMRGVPTVSGKCVNGCDFSFDGQLALQSASSKNSLLTNWVFNDELDKDPIETNTPGVINLEQYVQLLSSLPGCKSIKLMSLVKRGVIEVSL